MIFDREIRTADGEYSFAPMTEDDLPLLYSWARQPHVMKWWDTEGTWEHFHRRYLENIRSGDSFPFIVSHRGRPFAYVNAWPVEGDPDFAGRFPPGSYGVDQFIGPPEMVGRGHGSRFVEAFTRELLENVGAPLVMVDPHPDNFAAIRCYEKAGFRAVRRAQTAEGPVLILERVL